MKRRYIIILIVLISSLVAYIIYTTLKEDKISIVALGDGIASGETSYNIDGISYNDYIKEYFIDKKLLKNYNSDYALKNYKITDLINDLHNNIVNKDTDLNIQQIIHKASLITLGIGEEELVKLAITNDLNKESINKFIQNFDNLMSMLRDISDAKIVIVGYYENDYFDKTNVILLNSLISNIASKYNSIFINISDLMLNKEYYFKKSDFYFNYKGHKIIASMIINSL